MRTQSTSILVIFELNSIYFFQMCVVSFSAHLKTVPTLIHIPTYDEEGFYFLDQLGSRGSNDCFSILPNNPDLRVMAIPVVEFSNGGYKISKVFA